METFTFTFERISDDPRPTLEVSWSVRAHLQFEGPDVTRDPPPAPELTVDISK